MTSEELDNQFIISTCAAHFQFQPFMKTIEARDQTYMGTVVREVVL